MPSICRRDSVTREHFTTTSMVAVERKACGCVVVMVGGKGLGVFNPSTVTPWDGKFGTAGWCLTSCGDHIAATEYTEVPTAISAALDVVPSVEALALQALRRRPAATQCACGEWLYPFDGGWFVIGSRERHDISAEGHRAMAPHTATAPAPPPSRYYIIAGTGRRSRRTHVLRGGHTFSACGLASVRGGNYFVARATNTPRLSEVTCRSCIAALGNALQTP